MLSIKVVQEYQFGAHRYHLYFSEMVKLDGHDATTNHRAQEIYIDPTLPESRKVLAFVHEVIHIIALVWKIEISESDIDRMAEGFIQFLDSLSVRLDWSGIETR